MSLNRVKDKVLYCLEKYPPTTAEVRKKRGIMELEYKEFSMQVGNAY